MKNSHLEKCLFKLCWSSGDTSPPFRELEIGGILYMFRPNGLQKNTFFLPRIFFRLWGASPTSQSPSNSPALGVGVPWHFSVTWVYVISRFSSNARQNFRVFRWKFQCPPGNFRALGLSSASCAFWRTASIPASAACQRMSNVLGETTVNSLKVWSWAVFFHLQL